MHIPDGYLSPATCGAMYALASPFWYLAVKRVRKILSHRTVPLLSLFAAFSFVLMMFNIPVLSGTSAHAIGGTLLAIVLGPWAAVLGVSVALGIQALIFGDGGLMAFGANAFNMAVVLPLVGYLIYRAISGNAAVTSTRRVLGAVVGSYVGIAAAAFFTGLELGVQPALFHAADGTPLYAPYSLGIALPAMLVSHLAIAGPVEAAITGLVVVFLQRAYPGFIRAETQAKEGKLYILWGALGLVALATPIGLLASGTAWGEWGVAELRGVGLGFIPAGIEKFTGWWPAPMPDYGLPRMGAVIGYILSAFAGIILITFLLWMLGHWLGHRNSRLEAGTGPAA